MKKIFIIFILSSFGNFLTGQNLVQNPSFEDTIICPYGNIQNAVGWYSFGETPDLFHTCDIALGFSVPLNWGGYQQPSSGNAYAAITVYEAGAYCPDCREFIGGQLLSNLVIGTKYFVSFQTSLSLSEQISCNCSSNNLGAMFSTVPYSSSSPPLLNNNPHIYTSSIITDTMGWTTIYGSFIADSSYQYIMIGNFFDNQNTDTLIYDTNTYCNAYYYIDDICVSTDSLTCFGIIGLQENNSLKRLKIYPNPTYSDAMIEFNNPNNVSHTLRIFNYHGRLVEIFENINSEKFEVIRNNLPSGLYYFQLSTEKEIVGAGRLIFD